MKITVKRTTVKVEMDACNNIVLFYSRFGWHTAHFTLPDYDMDMALVLARRAVPHIRPEMEDTAKAMEAEFGCTVEVIEDMGLKGNGGAGMGYESNDFHSSASRIANLAKDALNDMVLIRKSAGLVRQDKSVKPALDALGALESKMKEFRERCERHYDAYNKYDARESQ